MDTAAFLTLVGICVPAFLTLGGFMWHLSTRLARIETRLERAEQDHQATIKAVDDTNEIVRRELKPNKGSSMFDRVANIKEQVTKIEYRLGSGDHRLENHGDRIAALETKR